ncbi:hypothetical protein C8F01DRAFT_1149303 [Mycena amicta]|nr:hypothetical protein C8F01DRAFT_1149303 [Mycena amicta]
MPTLDRSSVFRIISLTLAGGDVLQTIPGTLRLYKRQWKRKRISTVCIAYGIARYMSIMSLVANGYDAFSHNYTYASCRRLYMIPNITALLAGMAVDVLVFIRTLAISGQSKPVRIGLGIILLLTFPVETFGIAYHRDPFFNNGACKGRVLHPGEPDWNIVYYSTHMAFDAIACAVASYFLVVASRQHGILHFSTLMRHVLRDGVLYFLVVFLVNFWVVLEFAGVFFSGAASSLPLAIVLIAIQHLILSTQKFTDRQPGLRTISVSRGSVSQGPPRFYTPGDQSQQLDVELESGVFMDGFSQSHDDGTDQKLTFHSSEPTATLKSSGPGASKLSAV